MLWGGCSGYRNDGIFTECQWLPQGRIQAGSLGSIPHWDAVFWESLNKTEYIYPFVQLSLPLICLYWPMKRQWSALNMFVVLKFHTFNAIVTSPKMINETTNTWKSNAIKRLVVLLLSNNQENGHWKFISGSITCCMLIANEKWSGAGSHLMLHLAYVPPHHQI